MIFASDWGYTKVFSSIVPCASSQIPHIFNIFNHQLPAKAIN